MSQFEGAILSDADIRVAKRVTEFISTNIVPLKEIEQVKLFEELLLVLFENYLNAGIEIGAREPNRFTTKPSEIDEKFEIYCRQHPEKLIQKFKRLGLTSLTVFFCPECDEFKKNSQIRIKPIGKTGIDSIPLPEGRS